MAKDWEDAPSSKSDGWEEAPSENKGPKTAAEWLHLLTGGARPGFEQSNVAQGFQEAAKNALGMAETVGSVATGGAAMLGGAIVPAALETANKVGQGEAPHFLDEYEKKVGQMTYEPKLEAGQDYAAPVGELINRYGIPLSGVAHSFPMKGRMADPIDASKVKDTLNKNFEGAQKGTKVEEAIREAKAAAESGWEEAPSVRDPFAQMKDQLGTPQTNEGPFIDPAVLKDNLRPQEAFNQMAGHLEEVPAREADKVAAERQAQTELEVKRQATLDYNAAERARQEAAGTGADRSPEAISRDPEVQKLTEQAAKQKELVTKLTDAVEQGQLPKKHLTRALHDLGHTEEHVSNLKILIENELRDREAQRSGTPAFEQPASRYPNGEVPPIDPRAEAAVRESVKQQFRPGGLKNNRNQGGAINPAIFKDGFEKLKKLADGTWLRAYYDPGWGFRIEASKDSHHFGTVNFDPLTIDREGNPVRTGSPKIASAWPEQHDLASADTWVDKGHQRKGLATEMYKFASEIGNDIRPSIIQTENGKAMWNGFNEKGLTNQGKINAYMGNKQRGAILINATPIPPEGRPGKRPTPAEVQESIQQRKFAERAPGPLKTALGEFTDIKTKEEAIELGKEAKDIGRDLGQKSLGSGINFQAAMSNSPVLKFARYAYKTARAAAGAFSEKYVTADKTGLSPVWSTLKSKERVSLMEALFTADREKFQLNDAVMSKLDFTDAQRQFIKTFYEADKALYDKWKEKMAEVGLKVPDEREGHFPGIFTGSYKGLVVAVKDGKNIVKAVIATDTRAQFKLASEHFMKEHPGAKIIEKPRQSLVGTQGRYYSDIFSGMSDVMEILGKEDPSFAEIQDIVNKAVKDTNNKLFNFNVHELAKKGVEGNEGNKPWLSPERNANDAFKALVRYFEEGSLHHELQPVLRDVREVMSTPELDHLPNTMKYLDAYTKKVTGQDISPLGAALNTIIDTPFKLLPTLTWDAAEGIGNKKFNAGFGVGPGTPLRVTGWTKNFMSQIFMGWGNYTFTGSQLVQPMQTGLPFMQLVATRLGVSHLEIPKSMGSGAARFMQAFVEDMTGKRMDSLPDHMRQTYEYAKEHGMLTFSEMEKAYQGTQSKFGRTKDMLAEANMKIGELGTRVPMMMAFSDLLVKAGLEAHEAIPIAENLTQFSMIDYHPWERPMVYGKLGVLGQFAGGLTTFKHGYTSQQVKLGKEMISPTLGPRQVAPFVTSVVAMLTLAGITGTAFYNELDTVVGALTNHFGGERMSIRELFLKNSPEWLNSGVVSHATDLNIQGKFSSADMIPDSIAKAASPHLEAAGKIIGDAYDVLKNRDRQSVRNLTMDVTPSGWKGIPENLLARDKEHPYKDAERGVEVQDLIGRDGKPAIGRTEDEWHKRALTGLRPQREAVERETTWKERLKQQSDVARQKEISAEYERALVNGTMTEAKQEKLINEYLDRKGDINKLLALEKSTPIEMNQTQKQRLEGMPNSLSGANRFNYFNK